MNKAQMRKMIQEGMPIYFSTGKQIQHGRKPNSRFEKQKENVKYVEIDVNALPPQLAKKYFGE